MPAWKLLGCIWVSALLGGILGGVVGRALGVYSPSYYRSVFETGKDSQFDPVAVGTGLGASQGLILGALVGLGLVALLIWREIKLQNQQG